MNRFAKTYNDKVEDNFEYYYCSACKEVCHCNNFSNAQLKEKDRNKRKCLKHSTSSDFNRDMLTSIDQILVYCSKCRAKLPINMFSDYELNKRENYKSKIYCKTHSYHQEEEEEEVSEAEEEAEEEDNDSFISNNDDFPPINELKRVLAPKNLKCDECNDTIKKNDVCYNKYDFDLCEYCYFDNHPPDEAEETPKKRTKVIDEEEEAEEESEEENERFLIRLTTNLPSVLNYLKKEGFTKVTFMLLYNRHEGDIDALTTALGRMLPQCKKGELYTLAFTLENNINT